MKKLIAIILCVSMVLSFSACNKDKNQSTADTDPVQDMCVQIVDNTVIKTENIDDMNWEYDFNFDEETLQSIEVIVDTESEDLVNSVIASLSAIGFENPQVDGTRVTLTANETLKNSYAGMASTKEDFYNLLKNT